MAGVIERYYDNSYDNIGDKTTFVWYGRCHIPRSGIRVLL